MASRRFGPAGSSGPSCSPLASSKRARSPHMTTSQDISPKRPRQALDRRRAPPVARGLAPASKPRFSSGQPSTQGESNRSLGNSDAKMWFEELNNDASAAAISNTVASGSPFYLREGISGPNSAYVISDGRADGLGSNVAQSQCRAGLVRNDTFLSDSEDYRSIIDDLTVENRKLKQKLRKYEKLHCTHLQQDKLFEVRVHGLSAHKHQELETMLHSFAANLNHLDSKQSESIAERQKPRDGIAVKATRQRPIPVDSAYASNSVSEMLWQTSHQPGYPSGKRSPPCANTKNENVRSFIEDIPQFAIPSRPSELPQDAKKSMIVRRLEEVFTGKSATCSRPEFSQLQQEVADTAAKVENCAREARGHNIMLEGSREARILPNGIMCVDRTVESHSRTDLRDPFGSTELNKEDTLDQRPTRPMDLDPCRTQNGADNMEYIRHLGLASPLRRPDTSDQCGGWVYLNLLISMAQLHRFSVTPGFIREAIADIGCNLELSPDGHQVRWRGVGQLCSAGSNNEKSCLSHLFGSLSDPDANSKRIGHTVISDDALEASLCRRDYNVLRDTSTDIIACTPIIDHSTPWKGDPRLNDDDMVLSSQPTEECTQEVSKTISACPSTNSWGASAHRSNHESQCGLMIFYKNAMFCTDLSGNSRDNPVSNADYTRYVKQPLGHGQCRTGDEIGTPEQPEQPPSTLTNSVPISVEYNSNATSDTGLDFPDIESLSLQSDADDVEPLPFEASGLGGVQPKDNFLVDVAMQHSRAKQPSTWLSPFSRKSLRRIHHRTSSASAAALADPRSTSCRINQSRTEERLLSTRTTNLPPSSLPQPSYVGLPFSSSDSDDSDLDDDDDESRLDESDVPYDFTTSGPRPDSNGLTISRRVIPFLQAMSM